MSKPEKGEKTPKTTPRRKVSDFITFPVIVLLGLVLIFGWFAFGKPVSTKESMKVQPITEEIVQSFKISSLTYRYTNVVYRETVKSFGGLDVPFTNAYFAVRYEGVMEIGIDGSQLLVTTNGDEIIITVPPAQFLSHTLVPDTTEVLFDKGGLLNSNKIENYVSLFEFEREQMEANARASGLLDEASISAHQQLRSFLESLPGMDAYTITFEDAETGHRIQASDLPDGQPR
ncbi:MAG: DUF4230 domain-containing protein [Propionibacteriaceae bacterium]|nr:DUF4230 domain-containing protein [Propionibacteriaceae bacterium]